MRAGNLGRNQGSSSNPFVRGLDYVIENRLLLKKTKQKQKIKKKPKRGWFRSVDDVHVIYAALYTPDMATHGAPDLVPRP